MSSNDFFSSERYRTPATNNSSPCKADVGYVGDVNQDTIPFLSSQDSTPPGSTIERTKRNRSDKGDVSDVNQDSTPVGSTIERTKKKRSDKGDVSDVNQDSTPVGSTIERTKRNRSDKGDVSDVNQDSTPVGSTIERTKKKRSDKGDVSDVNQDSTPVGSTIERTKRNRSDKGDVSDVNQDSTPIGSTIGRTKRKRGDKDVGYVNNVNQDSTPPGSTIKRTKRKRSDKGNVGDVNSTPLESAVKSKQLERISHKKHPHDTTKKKKGKLTSRSVNDYPSDLSCSDSEHFNDVTSSRNLNPVISDDTKGSGDNKSAITSCETVQEKEFDTESMELEFSAVGTGLSVHESCHPDLPLQKMVKRSPKKDDDLVVSCVNISNDTGCSPKVLTNILNERGPEHFQPSLDDDDNKSSVCDSEVSNSTSSYMSPKHSLSQVNPVLSDSPLNDSSDDELAVIKYSVVDKFSPCCTHEESDELKAPQSKTTTSSDSGNVE